MEESDRVYRTKEAIRRALVDLLETHEIANIKAVDVYTKARVSKATFYRYYRDVFDLLMECFEQYLDVQEHMHQVVERHEVVETCYENILIGTRNVERNRRLYLVSVQCTYDPFIRDFAERSVNLSLESTRALIEGRGVTQANCAIEIDRLARLCIALSSEILVSWAKGGCVESAEEVARLQETCFIRFIDSMRIDV